MTSASDDRCQRGRTLGGGARRHRPAAPPGSVPPRSALGALRPAPRPPRLRGPAHQPHRPRDRRRVRDLEVPGAPRPGGHDRPHRLTPGHDDRGRSPMVVGRRRHARADARPFDGSESQEPVVVQRPGPRPSRRPPRHRHRRWWPRQSLRPGALPHVTIEAQCQRHARVLADGGCRGVPELVTPVFRHNRIVRDRAWRRHRRRRARVEHAIARLKDWRVLRDHRRRGRFLLDTVRAVAFLHNLRIEIRDSSKAAATSGRGRGSASARGAALWRRRAHARSGRARTAAAARACRTRRGRPGDRGLRVEPHPGVVQPRCHPQAPGSPRWRVHQPSRLRHRGAMVPGTYAPHPVVLPPARGCRS